MSGSGLNTNMKLNLSGAGLTTSASPAKTPRTARTDGPLASARSALASPREGAGVPWRCCPGSKCGTFGPHPPYIPENEFSVALASARSTAGPNDGSNTARSTMSRRAVVDQKNAAKRLVPMKVGKVDPKKFTKSVIFMTDKSAMAILMKKGF